MNSVFKIDFGNWLLGFSLIIIGVAHYIDGARPLIYIIPIVFLFGIIVLEINFRNLNSSLILNRLLITYCIITIIPYLLNFNELEIVRFMKEVFFIFSGILSAYLLIIILPQEKIQSGIASLFVIYTLVVLAISIVSKGSININLVETFINSESENESTGCFIFGAFFVYFFIVKNYKLSVLSLLMVLFTSKRIVFLAIIIIIVFYLINKFLGIGDVSRREYKWKINVFSIAIVALNIFILFFLFNLSQGTFDYFIQNKIGISPELLFMGRLGVFKAMFDHIGSLPFQGLGLSYTSSMLAGGFLNVKLELMHSDIIKYFIEFGLIGFSLLLFVLYRTSLEYSKGIYLVLYYNILAFSDNITIYMEVMFIIYFLLHTLSKWEFQKIFYVSNN